MEIQLVLNKAHFDTEGATPRMRMAYFAIHAHPSGKRSLVGRVDCIVNADGPRWECRRHGKLVATCPRPEAAKHAIAEQIGHEDEDILLDDALAQPGLPEMMRVYGDVGQPTPRDAHANGIRQTIRDTPNRIADHFAWEIVHNGDTFEVEFQDPPPGEPEDMRIVVNGTGNCYRCYALSNGRWAVESAPPYDSTHDTLEEALAHCILLVRADSGPDDEDPAIVREAHARFADRVRAQRRHTMESMLNLDSEALMAALDKITAGAD